MTTPTTPATINFNGTQLLTAQTDNGIFVAVSPICDAIGINWRSQRQKIAKMGDRLRAVSIVLPSNGGPQTHLCIPLKKLNGWLFTINPNKVTVAIRENLIRYQDECFAVLHDYWHKGQATNPRSGQHTTSQLTDAATERYPALSLAIDAANSSAENGSSGQLVRTILSHISGPKTLNETFPHLNRYIDAADSLAQTGDRKGAVNILASFVRMERQTKSKPKPAGIGKFIAEKCETGKDKTCYPPELYKAYLDWCRGGGGNPVTKPSFYGLIKRRCRIHRQRKVNDSRQSFSGISIA